MSAISGSLISGLSKEGNTISPRVFRISQMILGCPLDAYNRKASRRLDLPTLFFPTIRLTRHKRSICSWRNPQKPRISSESRMRVPMASPLLCVVVCTYVSLGALLHCITLAMSARLPIVLLVGDDERDGHKFLIIRILVFRQRVLVSRKFQGISIIICTDLL